MNEKLNLIETYNKSAKGLAQKFDNLKARIPDINEVLNLVKKKNPKVLELGCGNGRDAFEISKRTDNYLGVDISREMVKLARKKVPNANFKVADMVEFNFPKGLDIIFAFASLLHLNKKDFSKVIENSFRSLNSSGILRLSVKYSSEHKKIIKIDEFGSRINYLYSKKDIRNMANGFFISKESVVSIKGKKWLEVILKKP